MEKKVMGRPKSDNPKGENLIVRVSPDEKADLAKKAKSAGVSVSQWVRTSLFGTGKKGPLKRD